MYKTYVSAPIVTTPDFHKLPHKPEAIINLWKTSQSGKIFVFGFGIPGSVFSTCAHSTGWPTIAGKPHTDWIILGDRISAQSGEQQSDAHLAHEAKFYFFIFFSPKTLNFSIIHHRNFSKFPQIFDAF